MGTKEFAKLCDKLASKFGDRFKPNALLKEMAARNETFYGRFQKPAEKQKAA